MHTAKWRAISLLVLCLAVVACHREAPQSVARAQLASALRDSLGERADPNVAFISDGGPRESHLYLAVDTIAVPGASDSVFERRARDLARFAVRHYGNASTLDSITVATRELQQPGVWRVQHQRAFAIAGLEATSAP